MEKMHELIEQLKTFLDADDVKSANQTINAMQYAMVTVTLSSMYDSAHEKDN